MNTTDHENLPQQVRVMQVITAAMAMGTAIFGIISLFMATEPDGDGTAMISLIGVAFAVVAMVAGYVVPRVIESQQPAQSDVNLFQTCLIISLAIFEGAAFLNLIAYFLEKQSYSLAVAGILLALMLMRFPTVGRVEGWLDRRKREASERDAFGR